MTTSMASIAVAWRPREPPLASCAVVAFGAAAVALAERAAARGEPLSATAGGDALVLLGPAEALPWVDGAVYLGREHGLLVPTTLAPTVPGDLLARALHQRLAPGPLALVPRDGAVALLPLAAARLSRADELAGWAATLRAALPSGAGAQ
jgi:hypothetical protein